MSEQGRVIDLYIACFSNQFASKEGHGIARYSRELVSALTDPSLSLQVTPVAGWSNRKGEDLASFQANTGLVLSPLGRRITPLAWLLAHRPLIESWCPGPVDVVHALSLGYPVATRKPYVVTIHDLGPLTHPEFFMNTAPWVMKRSLDQAVRHAAAMICVSRSTAEEVIEYVGGHIEDRLHVIAEGVNDLFYDESPYVMEPLGSITPDVPYILSTGKISPRKNVQGLIQAFASIAHSIPHHLLLVGGNGWDMESVYESLNNTGLKSRVHFTGYVSDEQLRQLYRSASLYVHPSFYEGFGLTVLEAMASGCPVVTSDCYSLPEVAGEAAKLINPADIDGLAHTIESICLNGSLQRELKQKGVARARLFRWDACASRVADVYRTVAS